MQRYLIVLFFLCAMGFAWMACQSAGTQESNDLFADVKKRGHLIVGVKYDSPPFGFLDAKGELKGYEIELAREIAKRILGKPDAIRFVQVHTSTRIAALEARQVDFVLATMTITPKRAEVVNFTKPYFKAAQGVMVKADSSFQSVQDLAKSRVIFVIGGTGEANLKQVIPTAQLMGFKASTEAFTAFSAGRADAFSTDDSILIGFLQQHCGVRLLEEKISEEPYGIAFRKDKASQPLQNKVQSVLDELEGEGYFKKQQSKWHKALPPADCDSKEPAA